MKKIWRNIKKKINKFFENIAEDNVKSFGNEKLDCCQLNKSGSKNSK